MDAKTVGRTSGALIAASAVAAAAWREWEHRSVTQAELIDTDLKIERLADLARDPAALAVIEAALREEWDRWAFLGLDDMAALVNEAGRNIFVASEVREGARRPIGCLQMLLADVHGDPSALALRFPSFTALTSLDAWRRSRERGGDTAVLLQITVFRSAGQGQGIGSLMRDALLHVQPKEVRFALTMTPINLAPGDEAPDPANRETWTPAMRFHARGGAEPAIMLPGFKQPAGGSHGSDIVVMRYQRDEAGRWPPVRPKMRLHSRGPIEEGLRRLPGGTAPAWHGVRDRAERLTRRWLPKAG